MSESETAPLGGFHASKFIAADRFKPNNIVLTSALFLWLIVPTAFAAGIVRGFSGFGGLIVMLSILNFFLPPASSIPLVLCVDLCANIFLLPDARHNATAAVTIPLLVGTLLLLPVGVLLLSSANPAIMKRVIALFILIAALALLSEWRPFARPIGVAGWGAVGALTGIIVGATSLGVTAALFLNSGVQSSIAARANFIVWVFFANSALLSMLAASQGLSPDLFSAVAVMAPLYLIGSMAGAKIIHRMPENRARRTILVLIALAGVAGLFL